MQSGRSVIIDSFVLICSFENKQGNLDRYFWFYIFVHVGDALTSFRRWLFYRVQHHDIAIQFRYSMKSFRGYCFSDEAFVQVLLKCPDKA